MANAFYPLFKQALLTAGVNLVTGTVRAQLIDTGAYTFGAGHEFLASIPSGARIGAPVTLSGKSVAGGVFDAADATFVSVPASVGSAAAVEAMVLYLDTGDAATSRLIAYFDVATGLPFTPDGGNRAVVWPANGIFAL